MATTQRKMLSFIVPVLNEEENVEPLCNAVSSVMQELSDKYDYELIYTDNHSTDGTFEQLTRLARRDPKIRVIRFSRNVGYQRSILAGYTRAKGDAAIQLDCDLQDPPELIPEFVKLWESGHQVIYGIRRSRKERWWITGLRKIFYRMISALSEDHLPHDAGDFRLIDRRILDALAGLNDAQPYLRGAIASMGFSQIGVPYDRRDRVWGSSKFSFGEMGRLAVDGIVNHSIVPLRIATYSGLIIAFATFVIGISYIIGKQFFGRDWPPGFATTTVLILSSLSLNALFFGVIGEYLGRIYKQVKKWPTVIVEQELNSPDVAGEGDRQG